MSKSEFNSLQIGDPIEQNGVCLRVTNQYFSQINGQFVGFIELGGNPNKISEKNAYLFQLPKDSDWFEERSYYPTSPEFVGLYS